MPATGNGLEPSAGDVAMRSNLGTSMITHLRFTAFVLGGLLASAFLAGAGSFLWPVTTYELCRVAAGPYAPGHPGMAYVPRHGSPTTGDALSRLQIVLPALACLAALALTWRMVRRTRPQSSLLTLDTWNISGLDRAAGPESTKRFPASTYDAGASATRDH